MARGSRCRDPGVNAATLLPLPLSGPAGVASCQERFPSWSMRLLCQDPTLLPLPVSSCCSETEVAWLHAPHGPPGDRNFCGRPIHSWVWQATHGLRQDSPDVGTSTACPFLFCPPTFSTPPQTVLLGPVCLCTPLRTALLQPLHPHPHLHPTPPHQETLPSPLCSSTAGGRGTETAPAVRACEGERGWDTSQHVPA